MIQFIWDERKNQTNIKKHGVSFESAIAVFDDENGILIYDEPHSCYEERFVLIGLNKQNNLLTVCHCYRDNEETIRIISARRATKNETKQYFEKGGEA